MEYQIGILKHFLKKPLLFFGTGFGVGFIINTQFVSNDSPLEMCLYNNTEKPYRKLSRIKAANRQNDNDYIYQINDIYDFIKDVTTGFLEFSVSPIFYPLFFKKYYIEKKNEELKNKREYELKQKEIKEAKEANLKYDYEANSKEKNLSIINENLIKANKFTETSKGNINSFKHEQPKVFKVDEYIAKKQSSVDRESLSRSSLIYVINEKLIKEENKRKIDFINKPREFDKSLGSGYHTVNDILRNDNRDKSFDYKKSLSNIIDKSK